ALGEDHEGAIGVELADLLTEAQSVRPLGGRFNDDQVDEGRLEDDQRRVPVDRGMDAVSLMLQQRRQDLLLKRISGDGQYCRHAELPSIDTDGQASIAPPSCVFPASIARPVR